MKIQRPTVLVVDDEPNDLTFIKSAFRSASSLSTLQTVGSGDEAIAYLSGKEQFSDRNLFPYPDLVITDLKMPNGDGFAVLEHFKRNTAWMVPTVVLSGSRDNDDIKKAFLLGAKAYHVKPSSPADLRNLVRAFSEYWSLCEMPERDSNGKQSETKSSHKIGERFSE